VAQRRQESANPVLDFNTGKLLEYCQLLWDPKHKEIWTKAGANEFDRLVQGVGGQIDRTNTIFFVHKHEIPQDRLKDVTYIKFVVSVCTEKDDPNRIRATLGGNLIHYPDDVGTPIANLLLIKKILNSVISSDGAKFATVDLSNFYLMTPLKRPEYGRVKLTDIPDEIIKDYKLHEKATADGWVYFKVMRGIYGLPQSSSNSHDELKEHLNKEDYFKSLLVSALWKHKTRPSQFVLVVDDFGIKYFTKDDLDHLADTLKKYYSIKIDPNGKELVKIEFDWDYTNKKVHLSMKPYLDKSLRQFDNVVPTKCQHLPYPHVEPKYGAKKQFASLMNQNLSAMKRRRTFRKSPENSYGTEEGLMARYSPPSVQLWQNNRNPPSIQHNEANKSWTISPHRNLQFSHIAKVIWCSRSTAMPAT